MRRTIRLTGTGLAFAHLGDTPDQVRERFGPPTEILGSNGVPVPVPADIAYRYVVPHEHFSVAFYFEDGTCGEIRIIRSKISDPFTIEDVKADFEEYTGVSSEGCEKVDEADLKSIVCLDRKCLARTNDPITLFIEDLRFFAYEATAGSRSGK